MSENRIFQGVGKVVFQNRTFRNGKNYIWIRISRAYLVSLAKYWQNKDGFFYMKIYSFNRQTRIVGPQLAYITRNNYSTNIILSDSRFKQL